MDLWEGSCSTIAKWSNYALDGHGASYPLAFRGPAGP